MIWHTAPLLNFWKVFADATLVFPLLVAATFALDVKYLDNADSGEIPATPRHQ
jgi:hypothetical protein